MKEMRIERLSKLFRAVSNSKRIRIIKAMLVGMDTCGKISDYTGLPYKTVERHILILHSAGFIKQKRSGVTIYYNLNTDDENIFHKTMLDLIKKTH